jgi:hypothetical protein
VIKPATLTDSRIKRLLKHPNLRKNFPELAVAARTLRTRRGGGCCGGRSRAVVVLRSTRRVLTRMKPEKQRLAANMMGLA